MRLEVVEFSGFVGCALWVRSSKIVEFSELGL